MGDVTYRAMVREDIDRIIAAWFVGIIGGGSRKRYTGYFDEQERGLRKVFVAECGGKVAGIVSLRLSANIGPFKDKQIPMISNLFVHEDFREQGIETELMNRAEAAAAETSGTVCLCAGVLDGADQRLFSMRGYILDGSGAWCGRSPARSSVTIECADVLVLYMTKELR